MLCGEEPALIFPEDWGWRWWSWRQLQSWVLRDAALVESLPATAAVAFPYRPAPRQVALDLALQASGRVPLPFTGARLTEAQAEGPQLERAQRAERRGATFAEMAISWSADAWVKIEEEEARGPEALPTLTLPATGPPEPVAPRPLVPGSAAPVRPWAGEAPLELDPTALAEAARGLDRLLTAGPQRPIALVCGPLEELAERLWLAWGLHRGAAMVLVREPASTGGALYWSRPTVACLPAAWLPGVRTFLERQGKPRALRRRLKRFRALVTWGDPPAGEDQAWSELGFPVTPFPSRLPGAVG